MFYPTYKASNKQDDATLLEMGSDEIAYVKKTTSDQLMADFPALPPLESGLQLWALFSAEGVPLALGDDPNGLVVSAEEHHLQTTAVH